MERWKRIVGFGLLATLQLACGSDAVERQDVAGAPCDPSWDRGVASGEVVIVGMDAPCVLDFREIVRLEGELDGVAPRPPVAVGPDSTFLTATFSSGEIAVWTWDGDLVRTFGRGPGDGPGEFNIANFLRVDDGVVTIADHGVWHRYDFDGTYLESVRLPAAAYTRPLGRLENGNLVARLRSSSRQFLTFNGEDFDSIGTMVGVAGTGGFDAVAQQLWIADQRRYIVRRFDGRPGDAESTLIRDVEWFPRSSDPIQVSPSANLYGLAVSETGLVFVQVGLDEENPPAAPRANLTGDRASDIATMSPYRDNLIEVLGRDGTLLASRRYDNVGEPPDPINADVWFRVETDLLESITILEPVINSREP